MKYTAIKWTLKSKQQGAYFEYQRVISRIQREAKSVVTHRRTCLWPKAEDMHEWKGWHPGYKEPYLSQPSVWWQRHGQPCLYQLNRFGTALHGCHWASFRPWIMNFPSSPTLFIFHWFILVSMMGACFYWHGSSCQEGAGLLVERRRNSI